MEFTDYELYSMSLSKFDLIKKLGDGAMGIVYLCKYLSTENLYALKIIKEKHSDILDNLKYARNFDHPNLMKVYGYFSEITSSKKYYIIVMEYIEGIDLFDYNPEVKKKQIPNILLGIAEGIKYIHNKGFIHRDIKLENVIIKPNNQPVILDYDFLIPSNCDGLVENCGTPYYISPEALRGIKTKSMDIWSLGVILYALLTKNYPYDDSKDDIKELCITIGLESIDFSNIPIKYLPLMDSMLNKDYKTRIDINEVIEYLNKL